MAGRPRELEGSNARGAGTQGPGRTTMVCASHSDMCPVTVDMRLAGVVMQPSGILGNPHSASSPRLEPLGSEGRAKQVGALRSSQAKSSEESSLACRVGRAERGGLRRACPAGWADRADRQCRLRQYLCMRFRCKAYGAWWLPAIHAQAWDGMGWAMGRVRA
jgi:hypothetical protein